MVTIVRDSSQPYASHFATAPLAEVAAGSRPVPDEFIAESGNDVTEAFVDYLRPLVGDLDKYARLAGKAVTS
jgi:6-phosphofructokinase 1